MEIPKSYKALVVRENPEGKFTRAIEEVGMDFLPDNDVLIKVHYAALNYKDALSASGHKGITRQYPHTPGVDASGVVVRSRDANFSPGDEVLVTSYDLGMNTKGGFAEYISVPAEWVIPLPDSLNLREAMVIGTGGFTAALALYKMEMNGQHPDMGEVVITGASGGVGSMAVSIFKSAGYTVIASSGKTEHYPWLKKIGAKRCVNREEVSDTSGKPLIKPKWAGAIDTIGGNTLATLIKACGRNGNVAACGLVVSHKLETTVYPFILNGINMLGIESAETPREVRLKIWELLAGKLKPPLLDEMQCLIKPEEVTNYMDDILEGETSGRVVACYT
ncbi:MAG: YhdH/YhfP family quinone oxidoreductase [Cryomorphaceae bacterium]|nr:YhdH/YhfP family quinone oxidoreductase [Flavobacteriales bacterium]